MTITAIKGLNLAVMFALKVSANRRREGKSEEITIIAPNTNKPLLTIRPDGAIEEIMVPPMRVNMIDRIADKAVNGNKVQVRAAADFARRIMQTAGSLS